MRNRERERGGGRVLGVDGRIRGVVNYFCNDVFICSDIYSRGFLVVWIYFWFFLFIVREDGINEF